MSKILYICGINKLKKKIMKLDWTLVISVAVGVLAASIIANLLNSMTNKLESQEYLDIDAI